MEQKQTVLFIINPISGGFSKELVSKIIASEIDSEKIDWEIVYTTHAGHASELTHKACQSGMNIVAAVGGDGTVNEVASALVNTPTALAIIPCGSGNGLARHLHIPLEYKKAVKLINSNQIKTIDYGTINDMPFFCTCGMGFDAYISAAFDKSTKRGPIAYVENAVREVINYKPETYTIINDDNGEEFTTKAFSLTCANASQFGNNAYIAPKASMEDGLLDVTIVEPFNAIETPLLAYKFLNGTLTSKGNIRMFRSSKIRVLRQQDGYLHRDGEPFMASGEVTIKAIPQKFNVVVNERAEIKPISFLQSLSIVFRNKLYSNTVLGQTINNSSKEIMERIKYLSPNLTQGDNK